MRPAAKSRSPLPTTTATSTTGPWAPASPLPATIPTATSDHRLTPQHHDPVSYIPRPVGPSGRRLFVDPIRPQHPARTRPSSGPQDLAGATRGHAPDRLGRVAHLSGRSEGHRNALQPQLWISLEVPRGAPCR